jgi:hypothetical protein
MAFRGREIGSREFLLSKFETKLAADLKIIQWRLKLLKGYSNTVLKKMKGAEKLKAKIDEWELILKTTNKIRISLPAS